MSSSVCTCGVHAPEQHGPDGCNVIGFMTGPCPCTWNGHRPDPPWQELIDNATGRAFYKVSELQGRLLTETMFQEIHNRVRVCFDDARRQGAPDDAVDEAHALFLRKLVLNP